jgi:membrane protein required for beta-lactamase induction
METLTFVGNMAYILIFEGMRRLGKQDPKGFLFQSAGAFLWMGCGFFMRDAGTAVLFWNIIFGVIGLVGYRRLRRNGL